ncbi:aminoacyl-tRNA deacylase [Rhodohalobacter sp. 8-1]|uniref:aminoacyl-tRNA deacylase n=1 Tax=Rhodohalobacter sp. 8-1 TaxID=3131972 RepID=UPI0030ECDD91
MPVSKLTEYLDENKIKYVTVQHSKAFTAQEVAASAHIPGRQMAKPVMVNIDGDLKMVVLPSTHDIDFDTLKDKLNASEAALASEDDFEDLFPDCELGAMPPFGNLYDIDTIVSESLTGDTEIAFNAGSHNEVIKMDYSDYETLVEPEIMPVGVKQA